MKTRKLSKTIRFVLLFAFGYLCDPIYIFFIPLYLNTRGLDAATIALLLSVGPFAAMFGLPVFGLAGDRARSKNNVLKIIIIASAILLFMYKISDSVYYIFLITAMFYFFKLSQHPLEDTIALGYEHNRGRYGFIRLAGTVSFAIASVIIGCMTGKDVNTIFILFVIFSSLNLLTVFTLPQMKESKVTEKQSFKALFANRDLMILIIFGFIIQLPVGLYVASYAIYYTQTLNGTTYMFGWLLLVAALIETPFLLLSNKIFKRISVKHAVLFAALISSIRWMLTSIVKDPYAQIAIQALQGLSYIVMHCAIVTYINTNVSDKLKTRGQTLYALFVNNLSRIFGNVIGAFIIKVSGISTAFLSFSILTAVNIPLFIYLLYRKQNKHDKQKKELLLKG